MTLAEEIFNIAQQADNQKKIEEKIKQENKNKILKENTLMYWNTYLIPLIKQRAENGIYFTNLKIAQKFENHHFCYFDGYFPVEPVNTVYGGILSYKDYWDKSDWRHYEKYWKLPISINELLNIIKENGFYIKKEDDNEHEEVYDFEFSCKPYPKSFRESLLLTDKENNFNNSGCSKGEAEIEFFLIQNNIKYKRQFIFPDCKYQKALPFDFAIFSNTGDLICVIEYDGEQHYHYIEHWHKTEEGFKQQQLRDNIKTNFCKLNNIELIRIPYTDFDNIEQILKNNGII